MKKIITNTNIWQYCKASILEKRIKKEDLEYLAKYTESFSTLKINEFEIVAQIKKKIASKIISNNLHFIYLVENKNTWEYVNIPPALKSLGTMNLINQSDIDKIDINSIINSKIKVGKTNIFFTCLSEQNGLDKSFYNYLNSKDIVSMVFNFDDQAAWNKIKNTCKYVDISLTSVINSQYKYLVEKGRPLFFPEAANLDLFKPLKMKKKYDVVFIGALYGYRLKIVKYLRMKDIKVVTFGLNTENGPVSFIEMVNIWNQSKIVLGHGGIGYSHKLRNIKGRDFEVPATGGCYITTRQTELEAIFTENDNIVLYDSLEELEIKIKFLLSSDSYRNQISKNAYEFMQEHSWKIRLENILRKIIY